jgi:alpha-L-rhamnosidase
MRLYRYFESLRNSDGLLQNLKSWVFLEWSRANDFTQNVNYPSNMLYAKMLRTMGSLYDEKYSAQAKEIEKTIIAQSYYNGFFHDHAIRGEDGKLTVIDADVTETCQYYAFFTEVATPKAFSGLWCIMLNDFGPDRAEEALWQEIYPANAFIGNYLRLCLLERYGETQKLIDNIKGYFSYMAEKTGTLWENTTPTASCNHGFASIATVWLDKYARK